MGGPPPVNFAPDDMADMKALLSRVIASPFAQTDDFVAKALNDFKASGEAATLGRLFAGFAAPGSEDALLDDILPDVESPTLVVWGAQDGLFPVALADIVVARTNGARKVVLPKASHFPQIDDPEGLASALVSFLPR
jgi:pimeloyl-ACP methyl ester carboxylesterase